MKWRPIIIVGLICAALATIVLWVIHSRQVGSWFQVHTGIINESGAYYGFWSGFGSDITEFGVFGAIGAGVYQLFKKYNCHDPGCWRVGQHPAADGQFLLCYRHHPDYQGRKPTRELIERLHREHLQRQAAIHGKLDGIRQRHVAEPPAAQAAAGSSPDLHYAELPWRSASRTISARRFAPSLVRMCEIWVLYGTPGQEQAPFLNRCSRSAPGRLVRRRRSRHLPL